MKRILNLLTREERRRGRWTAAGILLNALLDLAGIAAILPLLFSLLGGETDRTQVALLCLGALAFVVAKNALTTWLAHRRNSYFLSLYSRLSCSMYRSCYERGLLFVREKGSVKIGHEINGVCFNFCMGVLSAVFSIAVNATLLVVASVALLWYSWQLMLILSAVLLVFVAAYVAIVKRSMRLYGTEEHEARRAQTRTVADTFNGYAEVEVNGAREMMERRFREGTLRVAESRLKQTDMSQIPTCLTEASIIVAIAAFALIGDGSVAMQMGVFALAAFRLLPSIKTMLDGWNRLQNAHYSIEILEEALTAQQHPASATPPPASGTQQRTEDGKAEDGVCMELRNLSFTYPDSEHPTIDSLNCTIRRGEYIGIKGRSGAGKSTLFNLMLGLLRPAGGEITAMGRRLTEDSRRWWLDRVGYVPQQVFLTGGTIAENIAFGAETVDMEKVRRVIRMAQLDTWVATLPEAENTAIYEWGNNLSGGQRQRMGIARALYRDIEVLLLDEATSSLDKTTEKAVCDTLLSLRKQMDSLTIISIAHNERTLEHCDRIITLS